MDFDAVVPTAAAVMVAVRLVPAGPAVKVTGAAPVASVVAVAALSCPEVAVKVRAWPANTELPGDRAVAVSTTAFDPSLLTLVPDVASVSAAAVKAGAAVVVFVVVAPEPQPARTAVTRIKVTPLTWLKNVVPKVAPFISIKYPHYCE